MREVVLPSGRLLVEVDRAHMPLDDLCGFGCRRSSRRGFVFVSKVLGKHWPVRPSGMQEVHRRLADDLGEVEGPAVVVGMAETATALGQGVHEQLLSRSGHGDILYLNTTRYHLDHPTVLRFEESHSHATTHLLYEPADERHRELFRQARTLILIDDEVSTGRTLAALARECCRINPHISTVTIVSLTDWLLPELRGDFSASVGKPTRFVSLLRGKFQFHPADDFAPGPPPDVTGNGQPKDAFLPAHQARLGTLGLSAGEEQSVHRARTACLQAIERKRAGRVLVLGTGEFSYLPYRLALTLEQYGVDVVYQSTTRSPLMQSHALTSVLEFVDNYHDDIPNYVYNVVDRQYDHVIVCYETAPLPKQHRLGEMLGAQEVWLRDTHQPEA